ncbi:mitochondrial chaperone [Kappamyces sp. JEL0829]|nr:mitochondrial chaperone [Kappamyces sp. JEL0829]
MELSFQISKIFKSLESFQQSDTYTELARHFDTSSLKAFLLTLVPIYCAPYLTGNFSIDIFITGMLSSVIVAALSLVWALLVNLGGWFEGWAENQLTLCIDSTAVGPYGSIQNNHYKALCWLVSRLTSSKIAGDYKMMATADVLDSKQLLDLVKKSLEDDKLAFDASDPDLVLNLKGVDLDDIAVYDFNIIPENDSWITIEHEGKEFEIMFTINQNAKSESDNSNNAKKVPGTPSISIRQKGGRNLREISDWVSRISILYEKYRQKTSTRSRWEYSSSEYDGMYWSILTELYSCRGLSSLALDKPQEKLIAKDLNNFVDDHDFYERLGIPYRRGYLFSGPPGTGKSSLINAISKELNRDLYYINLKSFTSDADVQSAFSAVAKNGIIVLEDIDAQSSQVLKRKPGLSVADSSEMVAIGPVMDDSDKGEKGKASLKDLFSSITLSGLLNILDGHTLSPGVLIIMTSNHPELLDPALIRPGRVDVHLRLDYCTTYQLQKMYRLVMDIKDESLDLLDLRDIPEKTIAPCDAMRIIMIYRDQDAAFVSKRLQERAAELQGGKAVGDALDLREE